MATSETPATEDSALPPAPEKPAGVDAAPSTAIQDKAPAAPATAVTGQAPPAPAAPRPEAPFDPKRFAVRVRLLDGVLVALVVALAFLLGSFAIQNGDFWMHLATGRQIAEGKFTFGVDPFSYTTQGVLWVNHSWLFDWLLYGLYSLVGAAGLVVVKGLLVGALAAVLLAVRRPGQSLWIPAVCTALALLVMSPRLFLQPTCVSLLFLGLTLYLVHRGAVRGTPVSLFGRSFSPLWLLPPLFALWVNLDGWFVLGPLTVALFLAGAALGRFVGHVSNVPRHVGNVPHRLPPLGLVLLVGLGACLLNPYLHRAFVLPVEFASALAGVLPEGVVPAGVTVRRAASHFPAVYPHLSPFSSTYWSYTGVGLNVAGLAYFPLLLLGAVSFAPLGPPLRKEEGGGTKDGEDRSSPSFVLPSSSSWGGLFVVWLFFAVLSGLDVRFLPFFAVVGGPVAALNLQGLALHLAGPPATRRARGWAIGGRVLTALGALALLLLAWPGWLHAGADDHRRSHRVAWHAHVDPLLEQTAKRLDELQAGGRVTHGFNFTPETAAYLAWFGRSGAMSFFDARFGLFGGVAGDYGRARRSLREEAGAFVARRPPPKGQRRLEALQDVFRTRGIDYVVLTGLHYDDEALTLAKRLVAEPSQWKMLYADGRNAIFGWKDPERPGNPFAGLEVDYDRLAFGPVATEHRAPAKGPEPPEGPGDLWTEYTEGRPAATPAAAEAFFALAVHEQQSTRWQVPAALALKVLDRRPLDHPLVALKLFSSGPLDQPLSYIAQYLVRGVRDGPAGPPVLAVRAARRATAEAPADGDGYRALASAYEVLWRRQESLWAPRARIPQEKRLFHILDRDTLRHVQYVTAVQHALRLQPDDPRLHSALADTYLGMNYPDAALEHLSKAREGFARRRLRPGQEAALAALLEDLDRQIQGLTDEVKRRRDEYDLQSANDSVVMAKVVKALLNSTKLRTGQQVPRGLALVALELLRKADLTELPPPNRAAVVQLQIRLTFLLGLTRDLRETFEPEMRQETRKLLGRDYDYFAAAYAIALGDYANAEALLGGVVDERMLAKQQAELKVWGERMQADRLASLLPAVVPLGAAPLPAPRFPLSMHWTRRKLPQMALAEVQVADAAEIRCLRGLLALEQGDTDRALQLFKEAERITDGRLDFPSAPIAVRYRKLLERQRSREPRGKS